MAESSGTEDTIPASDLARSAVWRVAQPGSDFQAWLGELTNATEDEGHVQWPWSP